MKFTELSISLLDATIKVGLRRSIGYITPTDKLPDREVAIFAEHKRKLEQQMQQSAGCNVEVGMAL